jgi:hypothetical protein
MGMSHVGILPKLLKLFAPSVWDDWWGHVAWKARPRLLVEDAGLRQAPVGIRTTKTLPFGWLSSTDI